MENQRKRVLVQSRQREYKHAGKPPLQIGDKVLMQDHVTRLWKKRGEVASIHKQGVSYEINGENG